MNKHGTFLPQEVMVDRFWENPSFFSFLYKTLLQTYLFNRFYLKSGIVTKCGQATCPLQNQVTSEWTRNAPPHELQKSHIFGLLDLI